MRKRQGTRTKPREPAKVPGLHRCATTPPHGSNTKRRSLEQPTIPGLQPQTTTQTLGHPRPAMLHLRTSNRLHTQSTGPIQLRHRRNHPAQARRNPHLRQPRTGALVVQPHQINTQPRMGAKKSQRTHQARQSTTTDRRHDQSHTATATSHIVQLVRLTDTRHTAQGRAPHPRPAI